MRVSNSEDTAKNDEKDRGVIERNKSLQMENDNQRGGINETTISSYQSNSRTKGGIR